MMFGVTRMKRVTDLLDDKAKARFIGRDRIGPDYISSGSEGDDDVTYPILSELFYGFDGDDAGEFSPERGDLDGGSDPSVCDCSSGSINVDDLIKPILQNQGDPFRNSLAVHVGKAVQVFARVGSSKQILRRNVMAYLRNYGYDAAICKTKWESSGGLSAGNYEFIDVLRARTSARYFVDLDFAAEFEIARRTDPYERLTQHLPAIFVGTSEDLKPILKVVSDAARRSLKSGGLHLPPWRKHRFMQNKWFAPYQRTTNVFLASFWSSSSPAKRSYGIKCRAVGFDIAVTGSGRSLFSATSRTR